METKLSDVDLFQVYSKWNSDLGSFRCFFRSTNFVSLKHFPDFILNEVSVCGGSYFEVIKQKLESYNLENTLVLLDISGAEAIRTAFFIRKTYYLAPILIFNGVLHPFGLIGDRDYISNLIGYGLKIQEMDKKGYILIFDHNRYGEYSDDYLRENFNNQYELGEEDLPSVELLNMNGYNKVVYLYEQSEKEDLAEYIEYLMQADIEVEKVNLA